MTQGPCGAREKHKAMFALRTVPFLVLNSSNYRTPIDGDVPQTAPREVRMLIQQNDKEVVMLACMGHRNRCVYLPRIAWKRNLEKMHDKKKNLMPKSYKHGCKTGGGL